MVHCLLLHLGESDIKKWNYAVEALHGNDPFQEEHVVEDRIREALLWQASRTAEDVIAEREDMICALEKANAAMWQSGRASEWYRDCHPDVVEVSKTVNGQLMHDLAIAMKYIDTAAVQLFRTGAISCEPMRMLVV